MQDLVLYFKPTCPFCRKVMDYLEMNGISLKMKDTSSSSEIREELIKIGGKPQVPCLVIDGEPLYESDDIINWLKNNYKVS